MLLCILGEFERYDQEPLHQIHLNKHLSCYRCLLETKEVGCLLGSDICLAPKGSSCVTLLIKSSKLPPPFRRGHSPFPNWVSTSLLSCTLILVPTTLRHCSTTLPLSFPLEPLPISTSTPLPFSANPPHSTQPCRGPWRSPNLLAFLQAAFSPSVSSSSCQHHSSPTSSTASFQSPSLSLAFNWVFTKSWPLTVHVPQSLVLSSLPLYSPRGFYLLAWLHPAGTYCILLQLNVRPNCNVKLPSGYLHLIFNLLEIDYIPSSSSLLFHLIPHLFQ